MRARGQCVRLVPFVVVVIAVFLLACGPTPGHVNNAGHTPYMNGDYDAARTYYLDALDRSPKSSEPHYNSGNVLYRLEKYDEALERYDESLKQAEGELRARGFFNRGNTTFQQEQYADAVEAYKEVLRMNPDDQDAKHNLELALLRMDPKDQRDDEEQEQQGEDAKQEEDEQEQKDQQENALEQDQPMTDSQARQILESVGQAAQTLQERRGQALLSPKPPSEFDW